MTHFSIVLTGMGWNILEHDHGYSSDHMNIRYDLSPVGSREDAVAMLQDKFPGCEIRVIIDSKIGFPGDSGRRHVPR